MKTRFIVVVAVCSLGLAAVYAMAAASKAPVAAGKAAVVWPAGDIKWTDNPTIKGAKTAVLWGDPQKGAYGTLKLLPAGSSLALHTHTQDHKVLVVGGTVTLDVAGVGPKQLAPGSYAFIPGGVQHKADCAAGADCVYLEEARGPFDIHFVK